VGVRFAYAAVSLRNVVAIANVHLTASPYGPELQRDGRSRRQVLENERQTRLPEIKPNLRPLSRLSDSGVPTFVVGDFPATTLTSSLVGELGGPDVDVGLERWGSDHRAVASTFEVDPAPAPALVGTDRRVVRRGDTLTIRYATHRGRLIGILPLRGSRPITTLPIYDASDHQAGFFGTSGLRAGPYRAALLSGQGDVEATSRFWVLARGAKPRIRSAQPVYAPGEPIRLSWRNAPGNKLDWVGSFPAARPLNLYNYLGFSYGGALPHGRLAMTRADLGTLQPGRYTAGLFMDDGYKLLVRTSFREAR
jgi:hypothetical protein